MLCLDGSILAVVNSLLVVMVLHCRVRLRSQGTHAFPCRGRKYRNHLLPCSHLILVKEVSRGSRHRRTLRTGSVGGHPCLRLSGDHHGHQGRVPWGRIVLQVGLADRSRLSVLDQRT